MSRAVAWIVSVVAIMVAGGMARAARAKWQANPEWEVTQASKEAAELGLEWLAKNQGDEGNWGCKDLGLVSVGALAFLSDGQTTETGKYRESVRKALDYVVANAKPSGLLNITGSRRDMYNHGLSTFVLTQAYGMTNDRRVGRALAKAIKLIINTQCRDGGWDYVAERKERGHDLSLAVMQAKALRGATDIGIHIPRATITMAIKSVQGYYRSQGGRPVRRSGAPGEEHPLGRFPGRFTYNGGGSTTAMAAAGALCLQEFGRYGDFRIYRSMDGVCDDIKRRMKVRAGHVPFDAYTLYYTSQALYQVGARRWWENYRPLRDAVVRSQNRCKSSEPEPQRTQLHGSWDAGARVGGKDGRLFGTAVAVFTLNIPNRYLPILQQGQTMPRSEDESPEPSKVK